MEDIAPALLKRIRDDFQKQFDASKKISNLYEKVRDGTATYIEANEFAIETGEILSKAFTKNITSSVLPDGKMYYNIAERTIKPLLENNYELISEVGSRVQNKMNKAAGIGIKAIRPELNEDKIQGILNIISGKDYFDDIAYMLGEPVINFSQTIIDETIKANAEFQERAGLEPRIVRTVAGDCCEWCQRLAGTYTYPDVPKDVYRRHQRCRCLVTYEPSKGKRQNVRSKKQIEQDFNGRAEARKVIGLKVNGITIQNVSEHVLERMRDRDVEIEQIKNAIIDPLKIKEIKHDAETGTASFQVIGEKATIAINPDTGNIVTTWHTSSRLAKRLKRGKYEN